VVGGEFFEGDSADMCREIFLLVLMGAERMIKHKQTRGEEPHWRPLNFVLYDYHYLA
jgi:hypothetical protein